MDADKILYDYCPELQLIDMLDWLQDTKAFVEIPSLLEVDSSSGKIDELPLHLDPKRQPFFPGTRWPLFG